MFGWVRDYANRLANNIDLVTLYARLKDYYKGIEIFAPWAADILTRNRVRSHKDTPEYKKNLEEIERINQKHSELTPESLSTEEQRKTIHWERIQRDRLIDQNHKIKGENSNIAMMNHLKTGVAGDTAFFGLQSLLSFYSGWAEKQQVKRVLGDVASLEFGKPKSELTFNDFKHSQNPLLREAAEYYGKKSLLRSLPDVLGLVRWVPLLAYAWQDRKGSTLADKDKLINRTSGENATFGGKMMHGIANFGDGIKMLMFAKTFFFQWYFSSRRTGSFYEAKTLWNMTEGIAFAPNRALNENTDTGEFVSRQHIAKLYSRFREENPQMGMAEFTPDDPLTSRVFEQTARYLNHTYMPKLFAITDPGKQNDLPRKTLTHAMLLELVGSGGLRVEDALGSALRLEVLAYHGRHGVEEGIRKYREVSSVLKNLHHPVRAKYASQDELIEATHSYLSKIDAIGREYLADFWPPKYMNEEMKEGFIKTVFEGTDLPKEKFDYIATALFMRDNTQNSAYRPKENDPASVMYDKRREALHLNEQEKTHRFADTAPRKRTEDLLNPSAEQPSLGTSGHAI